MAEEPLLSVTDLGLPTSAGEPQSLLISAARARAEREVLQLVLAQAGSNLSEAAKLLGVSRPTLYALMRQHQVGVDDVPGPARASEMSPTRRSSSPRSVRLHAQDAPA